MEAEGSFSYRSFPLFPARPVGLWAGIVEREQERAVLGAGRWMLVPAALAAIVFVGIAVDYPAMEDDFRLVRFETARIGNVHATRPAPDAPLMSSLTGFLRFARTEPVAGMSDEQLRDMQSAVERYPYAASLIRYATALALNGRTSEAARLFVKIRYIYGDKIYMRYRADLHDQVVSGRSALADLDRVLPEIASLRP